MNTYYEIQYNTKEDLNAWFPSSLLAKNEFSSYAEACSTARELVYKEKKKIVKRCGGSILEYRVVEYKSVYMEEPVKTFPITQSLFV